MKNFKSKVLSFILCMVLIVAMALCMTACNDRADEQNDSVQITFLFAVQDLDGNELSMRTITTEKTTVGDALLEEGLIAGVQGLYGLYVTEVDGITAEFEKNGVYWAFYVDDKYAPSGVDSTYINPDSTYMFKLEK